ncbi:hypothetical protein D3C87_2108270 [compost metagenome]
MMTLTTPPMESEPYSEDIGPRITSTRSIAAIGGIKAASVPIWCPYGRDSRVACLMPLTMYEV